MINSGSIAMSGARPPVPILKVGTTMKAIGVTHSLFYTSGIPGAAIAPSPGIGGAALITYAGQLPFVNPIAGETRLFRFGGKATSAGTALLYDRLWHNSGISVTTTTAQTVNSVTLPPRDRNQSSNGAGIQVGIEVSTATTNASAIANTTLSYTNDAGTAGRTATITSFPATAVAGTFVPFQLMAGDTGIQSIQGITLGTSYGGGAIHLVAFRQLTEVQLPVIAVGGYVDILSSGGVGLFDNTVPWILWVPTVTTATTFAGVFTYTQG